MPHPWGPTRIRLIEDPTNATPIACHHARHLMSPIPPIQCPSPLVHLRSFQSPLLPLLRADGNPTRDLSRRPIRRQEADTRVPRACSGRKKASTWDVSDVFLK